MTAYYRFYPGDYIRDTIHLGWLEDCAYRRLIDLYQIHSRPIRNDRAYIMRAVRANEPEQQSAVDTILSEYFELRSDGWHQKKCDTEIAFRVDAVNHAKKAAEARWKKKRNKNNEDVDARALPEQCPGYANQNQNQIKTKPLVQNEGFDRFWLAYPRRIAKANALTAWAKINPDQDLLQTILDAVSRQAKTDGWVRDNGKFIPHPATWLNARRWEDEVVVPVRRFV
jgi:uncharacterized protein YdaU (DUF1376 family)